MFTPTWDNESVLIASNSSVESDYSDWYYMKMKLVGLDDQDSNDTDDQDYSMIFGKCKGKTYFYNWQF